MNATTQKKNYALPIAVMFLLFFMISFVTGLQNPMGVIVKNQFGASNAMSQLGNLANFIAYAFMGIPAGILLEKKGYKFTSLTAVIVGFIGVAITYLSGTVASFGVYLTGAFISGFSMCILNTVVNPMLNTLGGGGNKGNQLIQFGGAINSIGATIVPVLVGYLMGNVAQATISDANPALFLAMGIFAFAFIVLLVVKIPEPRLDITRNQVKKEKVKDKHSALSFRHFILGIIAIFIYVGVEVGIPNIANLYMTTDATGGGLGMAGGVAGSIVGLYWLLMLAGRLVGGSIGAKVSSKSMLTSTSLLGIILILLAIFLPATISITLFGAVVPIKVFFL
ncbi:MAG: MFS transporter, partial [Fermentimonas sp.]|nr:MFS transporter [Fermentimonas sp.]